MLFQNLVDKFIKFYIGFLPSDIPRPFSVERNKVLQKLILILEKKVNLRSNFQVGIKQPFFGGFKPRGKYFPEPGIFFQQV